MNTDVIAPAAALTLGGILGADRAQRALPESAWVDLLRATAAGEERAMRELYLRLHRLVFAYVMRIVRDREAAGEITLEVFAELWRRAHDHEAGEHGVIAWLMNRARAKAVERVRIDLRSRYIIRRRDAGSPADPAEAAAVARRERVVLKALEKLTTGEHQALHSTYYTHRNYVKAAAALSLSAETVKTRIRAALVKLRQTLREHPP